MQSLPKEFVFIFGQVPNDIKNYILSFIPNNSLAIIKHSFIEWYQKVNYTTVSKYSSIIYESEEENTFTIIGVQECWKCSNPNCYLNGKEQLDEYVLYTDEEINALWIIEDYPRTYLEY
jgi:hypothetical protein